jgi:regulator of sirC expression with transglutaminase-like and TPR domain
MRQSEIAQMALSLAQEIYPDIHVEGYLERLKAMTCEVGARIVNEDNPKKVVHAINEYLFIDQKFQPDLRDPMGADPENFYLNRVLDRKKGVCTGLSLLYLAMAEELGLPVYGVKIPGHFFVQYLSDSFFRNIETTERGRHYSKEYWLEKVSTGPTGNQFYLHPLSRNELYSYFFTHHADYLIQGDRDEKALEYLNRAIQLDPDNGKALYLKGWILTQRGNLQEAIAFFDRVLSRDLRCAPALSLRGLALAKGGCYQQAIRDAQMACSLKPKRAGYYRNLAGIYAESGDFHKAQIVSREADKLESSMN